MSKLHPCQSTSEPLFRTGRQHLDCGGVPAVSETALSLLETPAEEGASILAVLCAARMCATNRSLAIYMSSEYVIRAFCYWAGDNETRGWTCANGDELRDAVSWLAHRRAPTEFRWVGSKSGNVWLINAKNLVQE
ncbi:hypothetical protein B0H13DRAFT_1627379, partial [Mycena leptocephala]